MKGIKDMMKEEIITGLDRPSDQELLRRAIVYAKAPTGSQNVPRFSCVAKVFSVGSTTATILCHEAGVDPSENLSSNCCEGCPYEEYEEEEITEPVNSQDPQKDAAL